MEEPGTRVDRSLQIFNRSTGVWNSVALDAPEGALLGAEGNNLVFLLRDQNTRRWVCVRQISDTLT
jgi:hypothetical protein